MWRCPACEYLNEDLDDACSRCGQARPGPAALLPVAPESAPADPTVHVLPRQPAGLPATLPSTPRPAKSRVGVVVTTSVSLLLVAALLGVTYLAWLRGVISLPPSIEEHLPRINLPATATDGANPEPAQPVLTDADQALADPALAALPARQLHPLEAAVRQLDSSSAKLAAIEARAAPAEQDETERQAQLGSLHQLLPGLKGAYASFEDAAARTESPDTEKALDALRTAFADQLGHFLDLLGRIYITDPNISRPDYLVSDELIQAAALPGRLKPDDLRQHWIAAVDERNQRQLDARYPTEYGKLAAWLATLHELRQRFNDAAKQLPPAEMTAGQLTEGGRGLLELYDAFADKLEALWPQWTSYSATLPDLTERPTKMDKQIKVINDLFQSEHLDCFTQMYRIYAQDQDLTHPAYKHLAAHYHFVQTNWPGKAPSYQAIFRQYEAEWDQNWHVASTPGTAPAPSGPPEPPGFQPTLPPLPGGGTT